MLLPAALPERPLRRQETVDLSKSTPLVAPPFELTQRAPNRGQVSKELNLEGLLPRPRIYIPPSQPAAVPSPAAGARAEAPPEPPPLPEPPRLEPTRVADAFPAATPPPFSPPAGPPRIETAERPKLSFERPGALGTTAAAPRAAPGAIAPPRASLDELARNSARRPGGSGIAVGDLWAGASTDLLDLPAAPGRSSSSLELLSDPLGVDFKPYLIKILASVRRNWFAVIPESAKLGRRGRVVIQFAISRDGSVPKLVIVTPSGTEALDRAAVAGISASNPLPPLPAEFRGEQVRLQFTFLYNVGR